MIQIDMEMPDCCGNCPCFHFENPMYCRARTDVHQRVIAPYSPPRPEWCPLREPPKEEGTVVHACSTCKWRSDDFTSVCTNGDSERRADFVDADDNCECWEERKV